LTGGVPRAELSDSEILEDTASAADEEEVLALDGTRHLELASVRVRQWVPAGALEQAAPGVPERHGDGVVQAEDTAGEEGRALTLFHGDR
jgi:hypothetical protein